MALKTIVGREAQVNVASKHTSFRPGPFGRTHVQTDSKATTSVRREGLTAVKLLHARLGQ